jgi:hypothetical protein
MMKTIACHCLIILATLLPLPAAENDPATQFTAALAATDFRTLSPNAGHKIREVRQSAETMMRESRDPAATLTALEACLVKLNAAIDPHWTWLLVYANVGADPRASGDPKLIAEYAARVRENNANNYKNSQQRELRSARDRILAMVAFGTTPQGAERWTKAQVLARFGKDEACRAILAEQFQRFE